MSKTANPRPDVAKRPSDKLDRLLARSPVSDAGHRFCSRSDDLRRLKSDLVDSLGHLPRGD